MRYSYRCTRCEKTFEYVCEAKNYKSEIPCPTCNIVCKRDFIADRPVGTSYNCKGFYDTDSRGVGGR